MEKLPWLPFYTGDWLKDPALSLCSPATRGVWIDLLCAMHQLDRSGQLRGTPEALARTARCSTVEMTQALTEIQATGAAEVTERNGVVTIQNRRMSREAAKRQANTQRQVRARERKRRASVTQSVTAESRDRGHISESDIRRTPPSSQISGSIRQPAERPAIAGEEGEEISTLEQDWRSLERTLRACGVQDSETAITAARRSGATPALVGTLIGHFEAHPKAWSVGTLWYRVKTIRPDDDPNAGWPEPSAEWKQAQAASRRKTHPKTPDLHAQRAAAKQEIERLEAAHGPTLDALSEAELVELVDAAIGESRVLRERYRRDGPKDLLVREKLLLHLSKQGART